MRTGVFGVTAIATNPDQTYQTMDGFGASLSGDRSASMDYGVRPG